MRIYLDNAATSWPKPEAVYAAVEHHQRNLGAAAARSPYREGVEATRAVASARAACARLLGVGRPQQLIFTANGTDALNMAIHGLLRAGDHVVTTVVEHNSVLRPLAELEARGQITVTRVGCDAVGLVDPADIERALQTKTRLVAVVHASNVSGTIQPVRAIADAAHQAGALVLVDAAQSAGYLQIDVKQLGVDLLATPGHKGLLGPLGTGLLYIAPGLETELLPQRQGGTGSRSDEDHQPPHLPDRFESGNLNVPGILGLGAGVEHLLEEGVERGRRRMADLTEMLLGGLASIGRLHVYGPRRPAAQVGLVSLNIEGYDPQEVATALDVNFRIQVRPGLHCAPRMHAALGTLPGGTLRLSLGHFTTAEEIAAVLAALGELAAS